MKLVKDYMHKKVLTTRPSDSIFKAAEILSKHHISGMPVVSKNKVVGMITESDIIKFMKLDLEKRHSEIVNEPHAISVVLLMMFQGQMKVKEELEKLSRIKVRDFMTKSIVSATLDDNILEAANLLDKYDIDRLPVIDKGKLVGIIARSDLINALVD